MEKNAENYIKKWERRKELEIVTGITIRKHDLIPVQNRITLLGLQGGDFWTSDVMKFYGILI